MSINKLELREYSRRAAGAALMALLAAVPMVSALDEKPPDKPADKAEQPADKPADKKDEAKVSAGPDGFVIQGSDYRMRIGGYLQVDGRFYAQDKDSVATNTFLLRRARPIFQGTVGKYFDFYLSTDFGQGQVTLFDAYLNVKTSNKLQLRVGKFKPPVGLERLQSAASIMFVERALPTALVPNRDVGVQLHGELAGGVAAYAIGVFDGALDGALIDVDANDGKDVAGRVFFQPFVRGSSTLKGLGVGIAGTKGKQLGLPLPSFRTGGQIVFFSYLPTATADGTRTRVAPQASFYAGPVGLFGEWTRSRQHVRKGADAAESVANDAWDVSGSVLLTGEAATAAGVRPRRSFDPAKGTWGALELAARVNGFDVDPTAFSGGYADPARSARKARAWAVGFNWYLNRNVKYVLDYERTTFTGGAAGGGDRRPENAILFRSQVAF
jgi:phosphate-selective porin OprO/OprP